MKKVKSKLSGVPETMLIPIRARVLETKLENGIISDPKSVEILEQIDYDFSGKKEVSKGSQKGVAIRTEILDEQTNKFLSKHTDAVVVNLGCGLDTRFHRLNNGSVSWFDLDLPDAIELRRNFFTESDNFKLVSRSLFYFTWMELIPKGRPTLFLAEGLLMYFTEEEEKSLFKTIANNFSRAEFLLEAMAPFMAKRTKQHADVKKYDAMFKWGIKTGKEIDNWTVGAVFINEYYYLDRHKDKFPFMLRVLSSIPLMRKAMKIIHIKFNQN